ncbi:MAG: trehalose-phosphatase [Acidimicrobiales bacterium]
MTLDPRPDRCARRSGDRALAPRRVGLRRRDRTDRRRPRRRAGSAGLLEALAALGSLDNTEVALVSGRSLDFLQNIPGAPSGVWLAGSHGAELGHRPPAALEPKQQHLLDLVTSDLRTLANSTDGASVEEKSGSVAFHYRNVDPSLTSSLRSTVLDGPGALAGIETKFGKMVIELAVFTANKGHAIGAIRHDSGVERVMYLGDDVTDEDAFEILVEGDVGIKVGEGATAAPWRVADPDEVTMVLEYLLDARRRHWVLNTGLPTGT